MDAAFEEAKNALMEFSFVISLLFFVLRFVLFYFVLLEKN